MEVKFLTKNKLENSLKIFFYKTLWSKKAKTGWKHPQVMSNFLYHDLKVGPQECWCWGRGLNIYIGIYIKKNL